MPYMRNPGFGFKGKNVKIVTEPSTNYAQFTPGSYMLLNLSQGVRVNNVITVPAWSGYTTALGEIKNRSSMTGLQLRFYWNQVEYNKGVYDFSFIGDALNDFADTTKVGLNKKIILLFSVTVGTGTGTDAAHVVPPYMLSTTADKMGPGSDGVDYDGGQWGYLGAASDGYRIRMSNANVITRLKLMLTALASYLRSHPNYSVFESLGFSESALGSALAGWTLPSEEDTRANTMSVARHFDALVPERMTHLMINYPNSTDATPGRIDTSIDECETYKLGFGSPDVFWDSESLWRVANANGNGEGAMRQMSKFNGARIASVQAQDQWCTEFPASGLSSVCPAPGHVPTFLENYNNCINILQANYIIWQRETQTDPNNTSQQLYQTLLQFYNTNRPTNTTRPSNWKTY